MTAADIAALRRRIEELEDRVLELEDAFGASLEVPIGFHTPRHTRGIWRLICAFARRGFLNRDQAMIVLYGDRDIDRRPTPKIVDVMLTQVRRQLAPHGIKIETRWGIGWSLDKEMRARAAELVKRLAADDEIEARAA